MVTKLKPFVFERPTGKSTQISTRQWNIAGTSPHQLEILSQLLNSDAPICRLIGGAGVGKTHTTASFIKYCLDNKITIALTGTTHESVAALQNMIPDKYRARTEAMTIHSYLGMRLVPDGKGGDKLIKMENAKDKPPVEYLICDEVSMLTSDLMVHLKEARVKSKVILVGDPIQLVLPSSANLDRYPSYELTINMRQDSTRSDISSYLLDIRTLIESNSKVLPQLPETSANLIVHTNHCEFLKAYRNTQQSSKVFACYMNKTVKSYNVNVKKYIVQSEDTYSIGDIIKPTSPIIVDGKTIIPNRAICVIQDIMDCDVYWSLLTDKGVIDTPKVKTQFMNHLAYLAEQRDWKEYYSTKERFAIVHHLYASTIHSLQGSTITEVYADISDMRNIINNGSINDFLRILYVGISRATSTVHLFIGNKREYDCLGTKLPLRMR